MAKPVPARPTELTVTAAVPDEISDRVLLEVVLTLTVPKAKVLPLTVN
jgi:hypothetical protein